MPGALFGCCGHLRMFFHMWRLPPKRNRHEKYSWLSQMLFYITYMQQKAANLHVSCVTESTMSCLRCTLVVAHLQVEFTLMSAQLFFCECTFILFGHLWSESWASVFGVLLGDSAEGVEAQGDLRDVASFEQVSGLENFFFWDSVLLDGGLESWKYF